MGMATQETSKDELELTLTLTVKYRTNGVSKYELGEALRRLCRRAAGNGDLTDPASQAVVLSWDESVTTRGSTF